MTQLIYNGISIKNCRTESVSYRPKFTEGREYIWTEVTITVSGIINPNATSYAGNPPVASSGQAAAATVENIRSTLMQPRMPLLYDVNGEKMIDVPIDESNTDVNNGPEPISFDLIRIDGSATIPCRYSVRTWIIECPGMAQPPDALLTNTWGQSHSIDRQQLTTIVTSGQAMFRTDVLETAGDLVDSYRSMLNIPTPAGFQRVKIDVKVTPSRNAITYTFVDQEQMIDLGNTDPRKGWAGGLTGSGIIRANVTRHVASVSMPGAPVVSPMTLHAVRVDLEGTKAASNWVMTQEGYNIVTSMLPIGIPNVGYLKSASITQNVTERKITMSFEYMMNPKVVGPIKAIDVDDLQVDAVFPDQNGLNPQFLNRNGTAGTYANQINYSPWKTICFDPDAPIEGYFASDEVDGSTSSNTGPVVTVSTTTALPSYSTGYSSPTSVAAFIDYHINMSYPQNTGIIAVPYATGGQSYQAGSGQPTQEFVTVAMPTSMLRVDIEAARVAQPPPLPRVQSDPNLVLLEYIPAAVSQELLPDGQLFYKVAAKIVYGMRAPILPGQQFNMGAVPYATYTSQGSVFPASFFVAGIDDGSPTSSGSG